MLNKSFPEKWQKFEENKKVVPNPTIDIRYDTINNETVSLDQPTVNGQPLEKLQDNAGRVKNIILIILWSE